MVIVLHVPPQTALHCPFSAVYSLYRPFIFFVARSFAHVSMYEYMCLCVRCTFVCIHMCTDGCRVCGVSAFDSKVKPCELTECILNIIVGFFIYTHTYSASYTSDHHIFAVVDFINLMIRSTRIYLLIHHTFVCNDFHVCWT